MLSPPWLSARNLRALLLDATDVAAVEGTMDTVVAERCRLNVLVNTAGWSNNEPVAGLYGLKPSPGVCPDEKGFRAMTDFASPGPLARRVADARVVLSVLADHDYRRGTPPQRLRIGYAARPEGRPVDAAVAKAVDAAAQALASLGHQVIEADLPLDGWKEVFGPLVLDDEHRERGHLLKHQADSLTDYERSALHAGSALDPEAVRRAHQCGFASGQPVGAQLVSPAGTEEFLLDVSEQLEEAVNFDPSALKQRLAATSPAATL